METNSFSRDLPDKSNLRIGVIGAVPADAGGAYSATQLHLDELQKAAGMNCEYFFYENSYSKNTIAKWQRKFSKVVDRIFRTQIAASFFRKFKYDYLTSLERQLSTDRIDLVFFFVPTMESAYMKRIPFVVTVWDLGHREYPNLLEIAKFGHFENRETRISRSCKKAMAIITDSQVTSDGLNLYYGISQDRMYSMNFCPKNEAEKYSVEKEDYAFYPANFWSHKNHLVLLRALHYNLETGRNPRKLVLTGFDHGYLPQIKAEITRLGIGKYVEIKGFVSLEEIKKLYQGASLLVMPSILGPTNLPPLEALLLGCPVVTSDAAVSGFEMNLPIIKISAFDHIQWARYLDTSFEMPKFEVELVEKVLNSQRLKNVEKFKQILRCASELNSV
jgi:glycosyltransferase involved in cell wall biosynthesis